MPARVIRDQPSEKKSKVILSQEDAEKPIEPWSGLDLSASGFHTISPSLFKMEFLTFVYLNQNNLSFVPAEISRLIHLTLIDLSHNKIRSLPKELGKLKKLKELLLFQNQLTALPFELGSLFQINVLGLHGNPLGDPLHSYSCEGTETVMTYLLDNQPISQAPKDRLWIRPQRADTSRLPPNGQQPPSSCSVFCFNVLCDKYATRQIYAYCPSWALDWDYRKQQILKEISTLNSDVILLQEVETQEFYGYFQPELMQRGFEGVFSPKSRARSMADQDRKHVDGCAIFYRNDKFKQKWDKCIEFDRLATKYSSGSTDMLNRVMPKDNIAVAVMLEETGGSGNCLLVTNAHLTWDPEFKDVKVMQTVMLLNEIEITVDEHMKSGGSRPSIILGGDFNSTPDSGVFEYITTGKIGKEHSDIAGRDYKFDGPLSFKHELGMRSCYTGEMPYTNYTYDFTGVIDYIFYNSASIVPMQLLGPVDADTMASFDGCPNPHFASDHFAISAELALL